MPYKYPDSYKLPDFINRFAVYENGTVQYSTDRIDEAMSYVQERFAGVYRITVVDRELQINIFDILPNGAFTDFRWRTS